MSIGGCCSRGCAIKFPSIYNHEALIDYAWNGEQVLLEKSKQRRKPTITNPEEYRGVPFVISRVPTSPAHGLRIVQHAYAEIEAGALWTVFDNCQDFVSRAYARRHTNFELVVGARWHMGLADNLCSLAMTSETRARSPAFRPALRRHRAVIVT